MQRLLILTRQDEEEAHSPELRYLASLRLSQARQVFDQVVSAEASSREAAAALTDADAVLLVASARLLVTAPSLAAMAAAVAEGAPFVAPTRLAEVLPEGGTPVYTLRGYEAFEATFLVAPQAASPPAAHLPLSMLAGPFARSLVAGGGPAELFTAERLAAADGVARGLYHEFIDYYGEVRGDVLRFVPPGCREVLEIGCGRGSTGELLERRCGCRVTGVELNPVVAREAARRIHRVIPGDVLEVEIPGRFDLALGLELFEHLVAPEALLSRLRALVRPGGRIVFSIPNVGHYSVVEDLLHGRWDYLPIGLLCYTHYRFFTARTLEDWLRRCGCDGFELVPQRTELPERCAALARQAGGDLDSLATKGFYVVIPC